jgi:hypothetical protein
MLLRRCRIRYRDPSHQLSCLSLAPPISANVYPQNPPSIPCPHEERSHHRRTSRTPTQHPLSSCHHCKPISPPYPNRKLVRKRGEKDIPKFEMLASLQRQLCLCLARCALQSQHDLLRSLGLLVEHGLRLTTVTGLFAIVTTFSLREQRCLYYFIRYDLISFVE